MAKSSADWQIFHKKFPQIAENPAFKADLGTNLDELDAIEDALAKSAEVFCAEAAAYFAKMEKVRNMADDYKRIVNDLRKSSSGIAGEFDEFHDRVFARSRIAIEIIDGVSARLARNQVRRY
jgi:hypothetical protein